MAGILLVDADERVRAFTRRILVMERHHVIDVGSPADARAAIYAGGIDLAVIDPDHGEDTDGYDLLDELRARGIPVLVTTARIDAEGMLHEARAGVLERFSKPVGFARLTAAVRDVLATDPGTLEGKRVMRLDAAELYGPTIDLTNEARERT